MRNFIAEKFIKRHYTMGNKKFSEKCKYTPINLGIGDLDINTDEEIIEKAMRDAKLGHTHYTDPHGYLELRQAICKYHKENYKNYNFEAENVMVVSGACHGLYLLFKSILNQGEEVILLAPYFPVYIEQIELSGGKPVIVKTKFENQFQLIREDIEKVITSKTKAIVLNTPSNPTGVCYNLKSLNIIREIAIKYDILVIADDVYDFFSYEKKFIPIVTLPDMKERTVTVCSFSKDFAMTGWRIGYIFAKEEIIDCINYINEAIIYSPVSVSQRCALYALKDFKRLKNSIVPIFKERIEYAYERIKEIKFLECFKPEGGIYLFVNVEKTGMSSSKFVNLLLEKCGILVIDGNCFGANGFIRIACTLEKTILKEAFDRISKLEL
ncbi:aminotransferase class I/II-fold pyridoxal phosphate-dependent enzyme [Fusobacterium sp.]|uniref:aminotransferase class I/II-fold pyridoxal phosphate-dependent enzyme n=1 Tax=Fusobacterium sp. TaxID=68766 RepID=UPI0026100B85|nr:aminotransferase class I/II-fold pyridoxal phosphate-dependent enzyme [Fusobacterium sp.]